MCVIGKLFIFFVVFSGALFIVSCNPKKASVEAVNAETLQDTLAQVRELPKPNQMLPSEGGSTQILSSNSYRVTQVSIGGEKPQGTSKSFKVSSGQEN